jgi:hypothetical protein
MNEGMRNALSTPAFLILSVHGQTLALDIALPVIRSERDKERERERERERGRDREKERGRKMGREREREM